jgi:hypothetical protein
MMSDAGPLIRNLSDTALCIAPEKRGGSTNDGFLLLESDAGGWERIVKCDWRCGILQSPSRHTLLLHPEFTPKATPKAPIRP